MNLPLTPLRLRPLLVALVAACASIALVAPPSDARTCDNKREQKGCFLPTGAKYSKVGAPNGEFEAISGGWSLVYSATFPCTTGTDQGQEAPPTGRRGATKAQRVRVGKSYAFSGGEGQVDPNGLRTSQTFTAKVTVTKATQAVVRYTHKKTAGDTVVCQGSGILKLKRRK